MNTSSATLPKEALRQQLPKDWFLRDSRWGDALWIFAPTSRLEEDRPVRVRWDFTFSGGECFTEPRYAALLESSKEHLAAIRMRTLRYGPGRRAGTVRAYFDCLSTFIRWMIKEGFDRFATLDAAAIHEFIRATARRKGRSGSLIARGTLEHFVQLLIYLHQHRHDISDALKIDPCPGQRARTVATTYTRSSVPWPYTPDAVAVPLVTGAIEFLSTCALDAIRAREVYIDAYLKALRRRLTVTGASAAAAAALRHLTISPPQGRRVVESVSLLSELLEHLYSACFIVIAYLVGARLSEILHLEAGCIRPLADSDTRGDSGLVVISGAIFKSEAYHGRPHEWIAPAPTVHAISVLEALSAPHRLRTGRKELWLRPVDYFGATEWLPRYPRALRVLSTLQVNHRLNNFGAWLGLPAHEGKPWRLSSHQGRKTFARFVALRDRTALFALAQHLGHRDRSVTDRGYAGSDYALEREIDAEVLEQSVSAWEHMLSVPQLGGRAGAEILAQRPRFRGARMKAELKNYARMLAEAGLILGVCDWGYCVYREEYSACRGNASGPNPVHREPSTCVRCKNFVISNSHRAYWLDQIRRHEALLNEPALPTQTLRIARFRLEEAHAVLRSMDGPHKGTR